MITREYLETEIYNRCNLACGECSHHSPYADSEVYLLDEFKNDLSQLAHIMRVKEFRILGGEPLILQNFLDYVEVVRASGIAVRIGICTNGLLLRRIDRYALDLIDFVDISYYPLPSSVKDEIDHNIQRLKSYDKSKINVMVRNQFRITSQVIENSDLHLVQYVWDNCTNKDKCHAIYRGYYFKCIISQRKGAFLQHFNGSCREELLQPDIDGISLYESDLSTKLIDYLNSPNPLFACRWCMGTSGKRIDHSQGRLNHTIVKSLSDLKASII